MKNSLKAIAVLVATGCIFAIIGFASADAEGYGVNPPGPVTFTNDASTQAVLDKLSAEKEAEMAARAARAAAGQAAADAQQAAAQAPQLAFTGGEHSLNMTLGAGFIGLGSLLMLAAKKRRDSATTPAHHTFSSSV